MSLEPRLVDLKSLFEGIRQEFDAASKEKGLELSVQDCAETSFKCDSERLKRMLCHLLENAIKFTNKGTVDLSFERITNQVGCDTIQFHIKDTGSGIKKFDQQKLLSEIGQLNQEHGREHYGIGLGLHYVRIFALQLGGSISIVKWFNKTGLLFR